MKINGCEVSSDRFVAPVNWLFKIEEENGGRMDRLKTVKMPK